MKRILTIAAATLLVLGGTASAHAQQYDGTTQVVQNWYRHFLGRDMDPSGVSFWVPRLRSQPPQQVLAGILASDEYYNRNGGSPQGMVLGLYRDVLNRTELRQQDVDYWVNRMFQYGSRDTMIREFLHDANVDVLALGAAPQIVTPPPVYAPPVQVQPPPVYLTPPPYSPYRPEPPRWLREHRYYPR